MQGGSLQGAIQNFGNQLLNGWPSLAPLENTLASNLTSLLQNLPSIVSNIPSMLGNIATQVGAFLMSLLRFL
ncbi:hypothetical protein BST11_09880 [Mycobacterium alsense]|nr:hypothetical protein BST11_09880 [Mycobacterium alsense]